MFVHLCLSLIFQWKNALPYPKLLQKELAKN